jgi:hypothetical protein
MCGGVPRVQHPPAGYAVLRAPNAFVLLFDGVLDVLVHLRIRFTKALWLEHQAST